MSTPEQPETRHERGIPELSEALRSYGRLDACRDGQTFMAAADALQRLQADLAAAREECQRLRDAHRARDPQREAMQRRAEAAEDDWQVAEQRLARLKGLVEKHRFWKSECWNPVNPHQRTCQNGPKPCEMCAAIIQAHSDFADELTKALSEGDK